MKTRLNLLFLILLIALIGCNREPVSITLKMFPKGIRYEKISVIDNGVCMLTLPEIEGETGRRILIPGNISWCDAHGSFIVGHKIGMSKPANWMANEWEKSAFFIVSTTELIPTMTFDEMTSKLVVRWFSNREDFDQALKNLNPTRQP